MLDQHASFDPQQPLEELLARVPAAWCVYLLEDGVGRPIQLLCVKNLRASLKRRLGGEAGTDAAGPTRKIDYRAVVRRISWTRVDSVFEQDWVYLETARSAFPDSYAGVLGFGPAWWIHVDPSAQRPRFSRTTEPGALPGRYLGPVSDKNAAQKLVHTIEDVFDLCRDPAALAAAPAGPCQWRQMGKCVGPCDGSVSLPAYRALVSHVADVLGDIDRALADHQLRMRHASAAMNYEAAGRIKSFIEKLTGLREGGCRHLRPIEAFCFLAVMPGRKAGTAKLFAITSGVIKPLACLLESPARGRGDEVLRMALERLTDATALGAGEAVRPNPPHTAEWRERVSLVAHHLFPSRKTPGVFISLAELEDKSLGAAYRQVSRTKSVEVQAEDEGEIRGLQSM